jgi:hypothetical protein
MYNSMEISTTIRMARSFYSTLEGIPKNWYTEKEQHKEIANWEEIQRNFVVTFSF